MLDANRLGNTVNTRRVAQVHLQGEAVGRAALRDEVLTLVRAAYPEPRHHVLRYAGKKVQGH